MYNIDELFSGESKKTFIIAELSANHNQDFDLAVQTIRAMKAAGADAVKLQTFTADSMTLDSELPRFMARKGTLWEGRRLYELYQEAQTPYDWHERLKNIAQELGMVFFSSPFDIGAVNYLEKLGVPLYKIASPEITDIPLIQACAATGKPVILSSGIATFTELETAVTAIRDQGNNKIAVLKCTTAYPAPYNEINLRSIATICASFKVIGGISDHTLGISIPVGAVALGAQIVEKHFILDSEIMTPDSTFSLDPTKFSAMVTAIRQVEQALGDSQYKLTPKALESRKAARSLCVIKKIKVGELFTAENIRALRPAGGLAPSELSKVLGRCAKVEIDLGTPVTWEQIAEVEKK
jgi:pseudaminic acid synthase